MACPFFEPRRVAASQQYAHARLPLIDEYEGLCRAAADPVAAPQELQFRCCNHGYSNGCCAHFPATEERSAMRYSVGGRHGRDLDVICVEEKAHAPLRWQAVHYFEEGERLIPEIGDICLRAQVIAFCRSYFRKHVK